LFVANELEGWRPRDGSYAILLDLVSCIQLCLFYFADEFFEQWFDYMDWFAGFFRVFGFVCKFYYPLLGALVRHFVIVFLAYAGILDGKLFGVRAINMGLFISEDNGVWDVRP